MFGVNKFDAVIGNPPYVGTKKRSAADKKILKMSLDLLTICIVISFSRESIYLKMEVVYLTSHLKHSGQYRLSEI